MRERGRAERRVLCWGKGLLPVPRHQLCEELGVPSRVAVTNWAVPRFGM